MQDNFAGNDYIVRAHVHHSMKNMLPLNTTVFISDASGYIRGGSCDCIASSLGRCAHVATVLFYLGDMTTSKSNTLIPSTSKPCTWNKGKKRDKTPQALHLAEYPSSKRKPPSELYNCDP